MNKLTTHPTPTTGEHPTMTEAIRQATAGVDLHQVRAAMMRAKAWNTAQAIEFERAHGWRMRYKVTAQKVDAALSLR